MLGDEHTHRCADDAPDKSAYVSSYAQADEGAHACTDGCADSCADSRTN